MKNISIIILLVIIASNTAFADSWGPKIKLEVSNIHGQKSTLYFGVDAKATDGLDKDTFFFDEKKLIEDYDLPTSMPSGILACVMIRDTTNPTDYLESYVDFRQIPGSDTFMHKFQLLKCSWGMIEPQDVKPIKIYWGKLPDGIDSAKFRGRQWMKDAKEIDMKTVEYIDSASLIYDKSFYITIWFNKNSGNFQKTDEITAIYPNITNDYTYCNIANAYQYMIINMQGQVLSNQRFDNDSRINVQNLNSGVYYIQIFDLDGKMYIDKIIKKQ